MCPCLGASSASLALAVRPAYAHPCAQDDQASAYVASALSASVGSSDVPVITTDVSSSTATVSTASVSAPSSSCPLAISTSTGTAKARGSKGSAATARLPVS